MRFDVISLLPEMFDSLRQGITGRAIEQNLVQLSLWNPRDYTSDVHRTVDDRPYGGGPGMVMMVEPLVQAITAVKQAAPESRVIYLSPQGKQFDQATAQAMADNESGIIFLAGRYEGIDERLIEAYVDEEWSVGDYVLSGGELPAMAMMDSIIRLLPGALGHADSAKQDSYSEGLLDCPHYTRPETVAGRQVPDVLLSGNHKRIKAWRLQQALGRTWQRRPDLLEGRELTQEEQTLLDEFISLKS